MTDVNIKKRSWTENENPAYAALLRHCLFCDHWPAVTVGNHPLHVASARNPFTPAPFTPAPFTRKRSNTDLLLAASSYGFPYTAASRSRQAPPFCTACARTASSAVSSGPQAVFSFSASTASARVLPSVMAATGLPCLTASRTKR